MTITRETVEHVAKLARLELTDDEATRFAGELSKIVGFVDKISSLDLSAVDVDLDTSVPTILREDVGRRDFPREALLKNAPQEEDGFFRVPRILDN
ncbi:MAG: Asp-tRNA(Asn)/Glu-tRNA(Gln) amidotransferase subunit GatC [Candidatus Melainabacteria bacterium]